MGAKWGAIRHAEGSADVCSISVFARCWYGGAWPGRALNVRQGTSAKAKDARARFDTSQAQHHLVS